MTDDNSPVVRRGVGQFEFRHSPLTFLVINGRDAFQIDFTRVLEGLSEVERDVDAIAVFGVIQPPRFQPLGIDVRNLQIGRH